jgi:TldD protein
MLTDIFEKEKALFEDGVQTVLRGQENRVRNVVILKVNLVTNSRSESRGINARVSKSESLKFFL